MAQILFIGEANRLLDVLQLHVETLAKGVERTRSDIAVNHA